MDNYVDCSSKLVSDTFSKSSPIPDLKLNENVSFICSIRFYAATEYVTKPKINVFSSTLSSSFLYNLKEIVRPKYVITKFQYRAPATPQEAFIHDGSHITCCVEHPFYYRHEINMDLIKNPQKTIEELSCSFRLNITYKPFIDATVSLTQYDNNLIECPVRAKQFKTFKLLWFRIK